MDSDDDEDCETLPDSGLQNHTLRDTQDEKRAQTVVRWGNHKDNRRVTLDKGQLKPSWHFMREELNPMLTV